VAGGVWSGEEEARAIYYRTTGATAMEQGPMGWRQVGCWSRWVWRRFFCGAEPVGPARPMPTATSQQVTALFCLVSLPVSFVWWPGVRLLVIFAFVLWGLIVNLPAWSLTLTANVLVPCQVIYARCPHIMIMKLFIVHCFWH
jgi:hypothetical protein